VDKAYQAIEQLGADPDYGKLTDEGEPPHKFYEKGFEALWRFSQFGEYLTGRNHHTILAMILRLNWMLADDYDELVPEGAVVPSIMQATEESYEDYQQALATVEQYIQENSRSH